MAKSHLIMAFRPVTVVLLLVALQWSHGVGVAPVSRGSADLPQLTVKAATHFQLGLQTVGLAPPNI